MPTPATRVGPFVLPVPEVDLDTPLQDPTIVGLLAYVGHWLKWGLDARLARISAPGITDACPVDNRFDVDPSMLVEKFEVPALFMWCNERPVSRQMTIMKRVVDRTIQMMWVFGLIKNATLNPNDVQRMNAGVLMTADAILQRAFDRHGHPTYAPPGFVADTDIRVALNLNEATYLGSKPGFLKEIKAAGTRETAANAGTGRRGRGTVSAIQNAYPCLNGAIKVTEEIGQDTPLESDMAHDLKLRVLVNEEGDLSNAIPVLERILEAPDGSEP